MRLRSPARRLGGSIVIVGLLLGTAPAALADSKAARSVELSADLDGKPIPLVDVARYHCEDLDFPRIHCFETAAEVGAAPGMLAAAQVGYTYVTIYDGASFAGASLAISEDYDVLAALGWNDRVSSFRARNSESGAFYTDWFHGGTGYAFCCNSQVPLLGAYNNTFSSVYRT
jgi:hypothetical protein